MFSDMAALLHEQDRYPEAVATYLQAIAINPRLS